MTKELLIAGFAVLLLSFSDASAVTRVEKGSMKGAVEISVAAAVQVVTQSNTRQTLVNIPIRFGGYYSKHFELEGELMITKSGYGDAGIALSLLGSFSFPSTSSPICPFLLAGVGRTNSFVDVGLIAEPNKHTNAFIIHLGGGAKSFVSNHAALRFEFRFQRYNYDSARGTYYSYKIPSINSYLFFLGCSIFP